jgi:hypothetical protein
MKPYHKIQTVFKRNPETKYKTLLEHEYSSPEFEYLANNTWAFTEKVDGTNIRVMFDGDKIAFGGKTDRAQLPAPLLQHLNEHFLPRIGYFTEFFSDGICLYGEGYGAKIQKGGGNYRSNQSFVLFDIRIGDWWLQRQDIADIAQRFGLDIVPIIGYGTLADMVEKAKSGFYSTWGEFQAEGIVARPTIELKNRAGHRIITKVKYKDFKR